MQCDLRTTQLPIPHFCHPSSPPSSSSLLLPPPFHHLVFLSSLFLTPPHSALFLQFPDCEDNQAIAVSCLDLSYRITFETNKKLKDERTDHTQAVVLNDLTEQNEEATINQKSE